METLSMEVESIKPFLAVLIPFIGSIFILVTRKKPNNREACSLVSAILMFLVVLSLLPPVLEGKTVHYTLFEFWPSVPIAFRVDPLGMVFALVASFTWILTTLYSIGYMRALSEHAQTRYYYCFAVTLSATIGAAFSSNFFAFFIFYELITFFTYPLVSHHETEEAWEKGNKYLAYLLGASKIFLVPAILGTYYYAGTMDFTPNGIIPHDVDRVMLIGIYIFYLTGISKVAFMPLHSWLPASMIAPTPVSALLHAVAVVNTGAFCVLRVIINIYGVDLMQKLDLGVITAAIASVTIIGASIYAMKSDNLKERIAYSTVSQLSYMVLGGALLTPSGMLGGIMHIVAHAIAKITLFFCAGSIFVASGKQFISQLGGIGRKMPLTMTAFAIATLSMVGIPPASGFVTKWYLLAGSVEANDLPVLVVLTASALLNAGYFVTIVHDAFFGADPDEAHSPVSLSMGAIQQSVGAAAAGTNDWDSPGSGTQAASIREPSLFVVGPLLITATLSLFLGMSPFIVKLIRLVSG